MCGGKCHAQLLVHEYHECLVALAESLLEILGVSGEMEGVGLDAVLVDWCRYKRIELAIAIVADSSLKALQCRLASLGRTLAELYLHLLVTDRQKVNRSLADVFYVLYHGIVDLDAKSLAMICHRLGVAVDDRRANIEHDGIYETLHYDLVAHSVGITTGYTHYGYVARLVLHCVLLRTVCWVVKLTISIIV